MFRGKEVACNPVVESGIKTETESLSFGLKLKPRLKTDKIFSPKTNQVIRSSVLSLCLKNFKIEKMNRLFRFISASRKRIWFLSMNRFFFRKVKFIFCWTIWMYWIAFSTWVALRACTHTCIHKMVWVWLRRHTNSFIWFIELYWVTIIGLRQRGYWKKRL